MPPRLRAPLYVAELVAFATLLRSVALDRWITVLASVLLIGGAVAAQRGKTWGVALAFASAVAFPVAWFIGIAPFWFCLVGVAGALPFLEALPALVRFDRRATAMLGTIAVAMGATGALLWKEYALDVFRMIPTLRPSIMPQHGLALAALMGGALILAAKRQRELAASTRVRVASEPATSRIAEIAEEEELEAEALEDDAARPALRRRYR